MKSNHPTQRENTGAPIAYAFAFILLFYAGGATLFALSALTDREPATEDTPIATHQTQSN